MVQFGPPCIFDEAERKSFEASDQNRRLGSRSESYEARARRQENCCDRVFMVLAKVLRVNKTPVGQFGILLLNRTDAPILSIATSQGWQDGCSTSQRLSRSLYARPSGAVNGANCGRYCGQLMGCQRRQGFGMRKPENGFVEVDYDGTQKKIGKHFNTKVWI